MTAKVVLQNSVVFFFWGGGGENVRTKIDN